MFFANQTVFLLNIPRSHGRTRHRSVQVTLKRDMRYGNNVTVIAKVKSMQRPGTEQ